MFTIAAVGYTIAIGIDVTLMFFSIFHIISFDELRTDYKDPIQHCNNLNPLILPEYGLHLLFNLFFLVCGEWFSILINLPLIAYHVHRYKHRPVMTAPGLYDPTSILDRKLLKKCQSEGWAKLAFYILTFFYYVYSLIYVLVYYD